MRCMIGAFLWITCISVILPNELKSIKQCVHESCTLLSLLRVDIFRRCIRRTILAVLTVHLTSETISNVEHRQ